MEYQDVTFTTRDGLKLKGWFIPNKKSSKVIIACHGYPMDKGDVFGVTEFLAREYNLLYFDFRAMGKSQGRISTSGWREREDFLSAVRFLKAKGFSDIGAFGFSMGGAVIFLANSPDIKCVVSDSSYATLEAAIKVIFRNFGFLQDPLVKMVNFWARLFLRFDLNAVAPVKFIAKFKIPILLIHCRTDTHIPVAEALKLHTANPASELLLIPQGDHGESVYSSDYEPKILKFFKANL
jgi:pimeloyl-ACP methyl ester carboxylesterase